MDWYFHRPYLDENLPRTANCIKTIGLSLDIPSGSVLIGKRKSVAAKADMLQGLHVYHLRFLGISYRARRELFWSFDSGNLVGGLPSLLGETATAWLVKAFEVKAPSSSLLLQGSDIVLSAL